MKKTNQNITNNPAKNIINFILVLISSFFYVSFFVLNIVFSSLPFIFLNNTLGVFLFFYYININRRLKKHQFLMTIFLSGLLMYLFIHVSIGCIDFCFYAIDAIEENLIMLGLILANVLIASCIYSYKRHPISFLQK